MQHSDFFDTLDTTHTLLASDSDLDMDCIIDDANILSQMKRNVNIARQLVHNNDVDTFKKNIIMCILRDLETEYLNQDKTLEEVLAMEASDEQLNVSEVEYNTLPIINYSNSKMGFSGLYWALSELIMLIEVSP